MAPKFDKHLGCSAIEMLTKFQSDIIMITSNLAASRFNEIWRLTAQWIEAKSYYSVLRQLYEDSSSAIQEIL